MSAHGGVGGVFLIVLLSGPLCGWHNTMAANGTLPAPPGLSQAEGPPTHEVVRDAVLRDIESKVAEKMEEVWRKGRQMLAQVHQKQQEKTEQLIAQIQQCKEQQEVLERENQTLKQVLTTMASHLSQLGLEKPGVGLRLMGIQLAHTSCGLTLWKYCIPLSKPILTLKSKGFLSSAERHAHSLIVCDVTGSLEVSNFPGLEPGTPGRGVVVPPGDLIMVNMYCGATTAKDVVPQYLYELQLRISSGQTGQLGMGEFFAAWRDWLLCFNERGFPARFCDPRMFPKSPREGPWPAFGVVGCRAQRSLGGWLDAQKTRHFDMGTGCSECGDPTTRVCFACCVGLCIECYSFRRPCPVCGERGKLWMGSHVEQTTAAAAA
eukprot:s950_g8.t1